MLTALVRNRNSFFFFTLAIILFSTVAFAVPQIPSSYYGAAVINGRAVQVDSVITAEINGVQKGSITVRVAGKYGGKTLDEGKLVVYGEEYGDTVVFYVKTPQMSNKLQAAETVAWQSGDIREIAFTFNGQEIPISSGDAGSSSGGGGGGGSSGGTTGSSDTTSNTSPIQNENPITPTTQITPEGVAVEVYDLDDVSTETVILSLNKGDIVKFTVDGSQQSLTLTAVGPGEALLSSGGNTIAFKLSETKDIDTNGDGKNDISVKLTSVSNNKAKFTFNKLAEPAVPVTGLAVGDPTVIGIVVVIIIIIGVVAYKMRHTLKATEKKKSKRR